MSETHKSQPATTTDETRFGKLRRKLTMPLVIAVGAGALAACGPTTEAKNVPTPSETGTTAPATPGATETPAPTETQATSNGGFESETFVNATFEELAANTTPDKLAEMSEAELSRAFTISDSDFEGSDLTLAENYSNAFAVLFQAGLRAGLDAKDRDNATSEEDYTQTLRTRYGEPMSTELFGTREGNNFIYEDNLATINSRKIMVFYDTPYDILVQLQPDSVEQTQEGDGVSNAFSVKFTVSMREPNPLTNQSGERIDVDETVSIEVNHITKDEKGNYTPDSIKFSEPTPAK